MERCLRHAGSSTSSIGRQIYRPLTPKNYRETGLAPVGIEHSPLLSVLRSVHMYMYVCVYVYVFFREAPRSVGREDTRTKEKGTTRRQMGVSWVQPRPRGSPAVSGCISSREGGRKCNAQWTVWIMPRASVINVAVQNRRFMDTPRRGYDRSPSSSSSFVVVSRHRSLKNFAIFQHRYSRRDKQKWIMKRIWSDSFANFFEFFHQIFFRYLLFLLL